MQLQEQKTPVDPRVWATLTLSDAEFRLFAGMIYEQAGVHMTAVKKPLVQGRLSKRLRHHGLATFREYFDLISADAAEKRYAVDLLTTHETSFFRHPSQFDFLAQLAHSGHARGIDAWSAACSTGEEAYSIAMILAAEGSAQWSVTGTDISHHALETAAAGDYTLQAKEAIPANLLKRYCLRGTGPRLGRMRISQEIRKHMRFLQMNILNAPSFSDLFDIVFMRNAIIYFDDRTKERAVRNAMSRLRPGGYLFLGGSESLRTISYGLEMVKPSIYRRP